MNNKVRLVMHEEQTPQEIRYLQNEGYTLEEIYVIAHNDKTTQNLSHLMSEHKVGIHQENIAGAFTNLFRSHGDPLRLKLQSLGLSKHEADQYEKELDLGKIMVMAWIDDNDSDWGVMETGSKNVKRHTDAITAQTGAYTTERSESSGIW